MSFVRVSQLWLRLRPLVQGLIVCAVMLGMLNANVLMAGQDSFYHHAGQSDHLTRDGGWSEARPLSAEQKATSAAKALTSDDQDVGRLHHHDHSHAQDTLTHLRPHLAYAPVPPVVSISYRLRPDRQFTGTHPHLLDPPPQV